MRARSCRAVVVFVLLFISGCAGRLPLTVPLDNTEEQEVLALLQQVRARGCSDSLDADVTVTWQGYGRNISFSGTLQATESGRIRISGLDPLGRPFFILVTEGIHFTLVDNRQGSVFTGLVDSAFTRQYIPKVPRLPSYFPFLAGQLPDADASPIRLARTDGKNTYWLVYGLEDGITLQVEIDPLTVTIKRQLLLDEENRIVLDVLYASYTATGAGCFVPDHITIEGEGFTGTVQLRLDTLYEGDILPDKVFQLTIPEHFSVSEVK